MEYTPSRVIELIQSVPWRTTGCIRIFWLRHTDGSRDALAHQLLQWLGTEAVVPLVLRNSSFNNANAVLSDVLNLFEVNRAILEKLNDGPALLEKLTVLILSKEDFRLVNASSPITLPDWFPICAATHTFFSITDLGQSAEVKPLNCPEARIENVSELLYELENEIVIKLEEIHGVDAARADRIANALQPGAALGAEGALEIFKSHITSIADPRAYRPNAADKSRFLAARILKLALNNSPKQLSAVAEELGKCFNGSDALELKPTFFAIMWRPANKTALATTNWHGIFVGFFQAYQLMNANAHAGEFPPYAVSLQHAISVNLRRFLIEAKDFVNGLS